MICVFAVFSSFSQHFFWLLDSCLNLIEFFKCMTWQSIFLLFFFSLFFILTICLLQATMSAIDDLPSRSISSHVRIVLKGWPFGPKLFISFLSKERVMVKSVLEKWVILVHMPQSINQRWFQGITILETCVFGHRKSFGRLEAVASLNAYQIINYQFLLITHHFCCLISEEFEK